ncbi:hypothetical protein DSM100238_1757 [Bifidobacterium apri]|uniref:Uncharacterized protein n=1 Tax=Bifidobacterium apri TaxID=1769423 RepID=A0A6A2VW81_9BIFI|nr:hypothetical protein DSM100238_1757 [Bifidobacterium apri]
MSGSGGFLPATVPAVFFHESRNSNVSVGRLWVRTPDCAELPRPAREFSRETQDSSSSPAKAPWAERPRQGGRRQIKPSRLNACAKPSSSTLSVMMSAARLMSSMPLPIATLVPAARIIAISLPPSPRAMVSLML